MPFPPVIEWVRNMGSLPDPQFIYLVVPFIISLFPLFRFGSPPQRDPNWIGERPSKSHRHQGPGGTLPPRTFINRNAAGTGRMSAPRNYSRSGGFKEGRTGFRPAEAGGQHAGRSGETVKHETNYRSRHLEQTPVRDPSPEADAQVLGSPEKTVGENLVGEVHVEGLRTDKLSRAKSARARVWGHYLMDKTSHPPGWTKRGADV